MIELHDRAKFEANSRSPKEENRIIFGKDAALDLHHARPA
jgi:hypothetical protein